MKRYAFTALITIILLCSFLMPQSTPQSEGATEHRSKPETTEATGREQAPDELARRTTGFNYSVQSQLVEVFLTVTKDDQLIPHLQASDFAVAEDGAPVTIDRFDNPDVPLQIVLLFDVSESLRDSMKNVQDAAIAFLDSLDSQDRVTLVLFNSEIRMFSQETDDRKPIVKAIKKSQAQGMTRLYDAMLTGMKYLEGKEGRKAIVCFTDGQDTSGISSRIAVINAAAHFGFPIYTIGAGAGLEMATLKIILRQFAEVNSGKAFFIHNLSRLRKAFEEVAAELRSAYVINYYTNMPQDGRWHDIEITMSSPEYKAHSRKGFFATRIEQRRTRPSADP